MGSLPDYLKNTVGPQLSGPVNNNTMGSVPDYLQNTVGPLATGQPSYATTGIVTQNVVPDTMGSVPDYLQNTVGPIINGAVQTDNSFYKTASVAWTTDELLDGINTPIDSSAIMFTGATSEVTILQAISGGSFNFPEKDTVAGYDSVENPATIVILNASNQIMYQTNKFILTALSKAQQERYQIIETFGDPTVYFFNDRTKMYTLQGLLVDSDYKFNANDPEPNSDASNQAQQTFYDQVAAKYQWAQAFQDFYTNFLRATRLKSKNYIAAIFVDNCIIKGYPLTLTMGKESSNMPDMVTFQMVWVIDEDTLLRADTASFLWNGGSQINKEFQQAYANWLTALNAYTAAWSTYTDGSLTNAEAKIASTTMAAANKALSTAESEVQSLITPKNNQVFKINEAYS